LKRNYYIHFPPDYNPQRPLPLVVLLHGGGGSAPQALQHYPLKEVADRHGFILAAPNGTGPVRREILRTWNVHFGFGYAQRKKVDDIGFVRSLILQIRKEEAVDPSKVYLTGLSNGAILCHFAAAAHSDLVAGIAPVVGTVGGRSDPTQAWIYPAIPKKPVDVILFNGELDQSIPLQGGVQKKHAEKQPREVVSAQASADFWVKANGCNPKPTIDRLPQQKATRTTWSGGRDGTRVVLYVLHNQGHAWPGGSAARSVADPPSQVLKAHEVLWDFFRSRPPLSQKT
jgi:polyhydroxybutyrate depolymerase